MWVWLIDKRDFIWNVTITTKFVRVGNPKMYDASHESWRYYSRWFHVVDICNTFAYNLSLNFAIFFIMTILMNESWFPKGLKGNTKIMLHCSRQFWSPVCLVTNTGENQPYMSGVCLWHCMGGASIVSELGTVFGELYHTETERPTDDHFQKRPCHFNNINLNSKKDTSNR